MEEQASNIILGIAGRSDRFRLKYGWFTFRLKIKPITARQLIEISGHASKIDDIDPNNEVFVELLKNSPSLWHVCKVIAIATGTRYKSLVAKAISKLSIKDIMTLLKIVRKQSDPDSFFFIMASIKGLNKMKKK